MVTFILYVLFLRYVIGIGRLYIVFSIGIEILLIFSIKALLNKK